MARRSRLIIYFIACIYACILCKLFVVANNNPAQTAAAAQSKWSITVSTTRGTIYDCHMMPFVNASTEYKAVCSPSIDILPLLKQNTTESDFLSITKSIKNGMPIVAPLIRGIAPGDDLMCFATKSRYGDRLLAPHLIGYCQEGIGVAGVEMACDSVLNRYTGSTTVTYEIGGDKQHLSGIKPIVTDTTKRSVGGVGLTLDHTIQAIVEDTADDMLSKGAVVVLDPHTGDIIAAVSYPTYQPSAIAQSLQEDNGALLNRVLSSYDCGSVFKIITAAAALENGVPSGRVYECQGAIDVGGTVFHCHNRDGHGAIDMMTAFSYSCNTYFIQLAQEIGADSLYSLANSFGFDRRITLTEGLCTAAPLMPDRDVLEQPAALANLSFGQGYLMTSPLHIAQITATVANDGVMPPVRLLKSYVDEDGVVTQIECEPSYTVISKNTAIILQNMMREVVTNGTGRGAEPQLVTAAGKTGTAETGQLSDNVAVVQSWFAGYFPAEDPQYVVVVLAEDSNTTNEQAASIFCEISDNLYENSLSGE